jgi:hypothetical protein
MMHANTIFEFQRVDITLPMQVIPHVKNFLSHIEAFAIILLNGSEQDSGRLRVLFHGNLALLTKNNCRPRNAKELYNLRHASLRNVIERTFGVSKKRFKILKDPPGYHMNVQVEIMPALSALHNFIRRHDPQDFTNTLIDLEESNEVNTYGSLSEGVEDRATQGWVSARRDQIAQWMWQDYVSELAARGLTVEGQ